MSMTSLNILFAFALIIVTAPATFGQKLIKLLTVLYNFRLRVKETKIFLLATVLSFLSIFGPISAGAASVKELRDSCISMVNFDNLVDEIVKAEDFAIQLSKLMVEVTSCKTTIDVVLTLGSEVCSSAMVYNFLKNEDGTPTPFMKRIFDTAVDIKTNWTHIDLAEVFILHANKDPSNWQSEGTPSMVLAMKTVFPCEIGIINID